MHRLLCGVAMTAVPVLAGCRMTPPDTEPGPQRTVAYYMKVESSVPGVSIETNSVFAGKTPLTLKVFGDTIGTFHNFGVGQYVIRALPLTPNQFAQTKVFRAGKGSAPGDSIPGLIFFDMSQQAGGLLIDSIPSR